MINPKSSVPRIVAANVCSGVPRPTACGRNAIQACELDSCGGRLGRFASPPLWCACPPTQRYTPTPDPLCHQPILIEPQPSPLGQLLAGVADSSDRKRKADRNSWAFRPSPESRLQLPFSHSFLQRAGQTPTQTVRGFLSFVNVHPPNITTIFQLFVHPPVPTLRPPRWIDPLL
jgi:hypothetical protein